MCEVDRHLLCYLRRFFTGIYGLYFRKIWWHETEMLNTIENRRLKWRENSNQIQEKIV